MFAIFVDAGFLLAAAAMKSTGSPARDGVVCDYPALLKGLLDSAAGHAGDNYLRTYWYDASATGIPDNHQMAIAELTGVKIRLGRLVRGEQKGVDARIIIDMMKLALGKIVDTIYLLSGDEDLVEAVEEAQGQGVRVVLVTIQDYPQSRMLCQTSDEMLTLAPELFSNCFTAASNGDRQYYQIAFDAGVAFGATLLETGDPDVIAQLRKQRDRKVPPEIDTQLMRAADAQVGGDLVRTREPLRHAVRAGFWNALEST